MSVLRLPAVVHRDGDWYIARCPQVEVASQGRTAVEAVANLREALELHFEDRSTALVEVVTVPATAQEV